MAQDAGVEVRFFTRVIEGLRLEGHPAVELVIEEFRRHMRPQRSTLLHGQHQLAHEAADQHAVAVGNRPEGRHQARRAHAAEAAGGFRKQHLGAKARGADGGGAPGRPAARNHHVEVLLDRDVACKPVGLHRQLSYWASIPASAVILR
jgi:hypothetical protein